jgi:two-component system, response regulator
MQAKKLIIIEDSQDDFEAIVRGFKEADLDCPIVWYKNSKEALEFFDTLPERNQKSISSKLVILDLNMPGTDGRQLLEIIKLTPQLKAMPVVIFSTSADKKDIADCYSNGASSYIQKPVNFDDLKLICSSIKEYWFNTAIF